MWPFTADLMLMDGSKSNNLIATVPRIKSKHVKVSGNKIKKHGPAKWSCEIREPFFS